MFKPLNRYLLIEVPQKKPNETSSGIFLPDDYKPSEDPHVVVKLLDYAEDARFKETLNGIKSMAHITQINLMVDRSMIEEIVHEGTNYSLILDNYVKGVFSE